MKRFMRRVFEVLAGKDIASQAVPEHMPILRAFQFASQYRSELP